MEITERLFFWPDFLGLVVHHMFIISPVGMPIYDGAIDNKATTDEAESRMRKRCLTAVLVRISDWRERSVMKIVPHWP